MKKYWAVGLAVVLLAVGVGIVESAWTGFSPDGTYRGAPADTWKGVMGILLVFSGLLATIAILTRTFPRVWLIPGLAIIEEATHLFVGYGWALPTWDTLFAHWTIGYIGFNAYPWLTFLLITLVGEVLFHHFHARHTEE